MTDNRKLEIDRMAAQGFALEIVEFIEQRVKAGADPALLSMAMIGCGTDLLRRTISPEAAAQALAEMASDITDMDPDASTRRDS